MRLFKVYHLDQSGSIRHTELLEAADASDAIARAELLGSKDDLEVWDRTRLLRHVQGRPADLATSWERRQMPPPAISSHVTGHAGSF